MTIGGASPYPDKISRFVGQERDYWRLVIRGSVLSAVTLGIYRFWYFTDIRRFLWSSTEFGGEALEYTGRGLELFLGFLIAIAVLFPLYIAFALLPPSAAGLAGFVILWLGQVAIYRARRYRLTRTVFRGLRFHQGGSAISYAFRSFGWWFLIILTLGLAYPWAQASLERYKMRNTFYGDLPGRFAGTGFSLFASGIVLWLIVVVGLIATIVLEARSGGSQPSWAALAGPLWVWLAAIVVYPAFEAVTMRWWLSGLRFGDIAVKSALPTGKVYLIWLRFLGLALLLAIVVGIIVSIVGAIAGMGSITADIAAGKPPSTTVGQLIAGIVLLLFYVVVLIAFSALYQVVVKFAVWRLAIDTLDISNFQMVTLVKAEGKLSSPFGEGLADALDVGAI
jgi:uncharacterized membrane protein YjgN (DUF898 family)